MRRKARSRRRQRMVQTGVAMGGEYHGLPAFGRTEQPAGELSEFAMDDQLKQQLLPAVAVFNLTLVLYFLIRVLPAKKMLFGGFMTHLMIAAGIAVVTGGVTLAITMLRKK